MTDTRFGRVALLGEANSGKSTLVNRLVGRKVSIVTHKVQTTRTRIRGISTVGNSQVVYVDTPGIFVPKRHRDKAMIAEAWRGLGEADIAVILVQAHRGITSTTGYLLETLARRESTIRNRILVVNKIDLACRKNLLKLVESVTRLLELDAAFMISARSGDGTDDLQSWIRSRLPPEPWLYSREQVTDLPDQAIAAEITRERLMVRFHDEIPYQLTVQPEEWTSNDDGSTRIDQTIHVSSSSQKAIVLGRGGKAIRAIGIETKRELEERMGSRVHLFLKVRVRPR